MSTATASLATVAPRGRTRGWLGMALFAASEATLIGSIIGSYVYLRINATAWPPRGTPEPSLLAPIALTLLLLFAVIPFRAALGFARSGRRGKAVVLLAVAAVLQATYLGVQVHLFIDSLGQLVPQQSAYASIYYVLLAAAHTHVAVGLLLDLWLLTRLPVRLTPYRLAALEVAVLYWYVVVAITVAVSLTELSPRL